MNLLRPLFAARSGLTSLGLASIGLACSACGAAPPPVEAPTVHLVPEPPLEPFVCGAMAHGPMGPGGPRFADGGPRFADGPRHGPHGRRGPRGEQGWHPGPGAPPPPWAAGLGPGATEPGTQPPPPLAAPPRAGARGAPRTEPLPLEIVRTHAEGEPTGWSTELRLHSTGAPLGAVLTELARTAHAAIVVDPELAPRPVVAHVEAASAEAIASQLAETLGGTLVRHGDIVVVTTREAAMREVHARLVASTAPEALETRVFAIENVAHARQLAVLYCHLQASPRGGAALLGNHLVVRDGRSQLDQLEALVSSLTAHEQEEAAHAEEAARARQAAPTP